MSHVVTMVIILFFIIIIIIILLLICVVFTSDIAIYEVITIVCMMYGCHWLFVCYMKLQYVVYTLLSHY